MRSIRSLFRRSALTFEQLESRLALSAVPYSPGVSIGGDLEPTWKPSGYSFPVGLTPADVRTAYDFDGIKFGGIDGDGTGQTIAIVAARNHPNIVHDLAVFDQWFGLPDPPSFTVVNQNGGTKMPKNSRGWASEIALDVEWAHAIAPAANILLVEAKSSSTLGDAIDYARHVPGVSVVSVSAGGKEFKSELQADELFTTPPGHVGITFVFASGDEGGKAEYPSSSPNVLSVGGTSLDVTWQGEWNDEAVWPDGGGGLSKYEGVPSYQNGLGLTSRGTPDVTYDGDPETGFAVYDSYGVGGWAQFGGTSAGTPQWAALLAIANQGRVSAGKAPLANAQAALYAMPSDDFHDIVSGGNGRLATPGYDLASGLGSPIADKLIEDLVAFNGSTDFTVTPLVSSKAGKTGKSVNFDPILLAPAATQFGLVVDSSAGVSTRLLMGASMSAASHAAAQPTSLAMTQLVLSTSSSRPSDSSVGCDSLQSSSKPSLKTAKAGGKIEPSLTLSKSALAGIDKFFARLAS